VENQADPGFAGAAKGKFESRLPCGAGAFGKNIWKRLPN